MSLVSVTESSLENIAATIRNKKGGTDTYTPGQMAGAINGIHTADEVVLVQKSITANGTYNPAGDSADGYSGVSVDVANSYTSDDNGKVVSNQQLVAQTSKQITANGTHDTTTNNSVSVAVPNSYSASDNGKVVVNQDLVAQTSKNINANGTYDTTANNSVVVDVPNSYAAADEGKVVSGGALVGQTSRNVTVNGTYNTTENNEVVVNVSGGGGGTLIQKTITQNGTYNASDDNADGFSRITVNVSDGEEVLPSLPSNYTKLDYVVFSKAQITIPHTNQNTVFKVKCKPTLYGENAIIASKENGNANSDFELYPYQKYAPFKVWERASNTIASYDYCHVSNENVHIGESDFSDYMYEMQFVLATEYPVNNHNVIIGRYTNYFAGRVYYIKVTNLSDNSMQYFFIPCKRNMDSVCGLYDTVNDVFYVNENSSGSITES
jgi:hypothetical protein